MGSAIAFLLPYVQKYAGRAAAIAVILAIVTGSGFYIRHKIDKGGYDRAVAEYQKRDADTARQSAELMKLKQHESDQINKSNQERLLNATKIYAERYAHISSNPVIERVFIRSKATSCNSDTMPGTGQGRPETKEGAARSFAAELPAANTRELDKTIRLIETTQAKCELLLNQME